MVKTRRQEVEDSYDDEFDDVDGGEERPRRRSKRSRGGERSWLAWFVPRLAVMLVLLAVCAWFAPAILAKTGLWKPIVATVAPEYGNRIDARSLSLGWLSPIVIEGVVVYDADGKTFAEVAQVKSQKTLLGLLQSPSKLGKFTITEPQTTVILRADGSNVEDFLASLPQSQPDANAASDSAVQFELELIGGRVDLLDDVSGRKWQLSNVNVGVEWPSAGKRQGNLSATILDTTASSAGAGSAGGDVLANFAWQPKAEVPVTPASATPVSTTSTPAAESAALGLGEGEASAILRGFPTEALAPVLRRLNLDVQSAGLLQADVHLTWKDDGRQAQADIRQLAAPNLTVAAPSYLGDERLTVALKQGTGQISLIGDRLSVSNLYVDSDLVQLRGQGSAAIAAVQTVNQGSGAMPLDANDLSLQGQLDVAAVAAQLPNLLHLQEGARLTAGQITWSLMSKAEGNGDRWEAALHAENLAAETSRGPVAWQQPISFSGALVQDKNGWRIEQLRGESRFLQLEGSGTVHDGAVTASVNLNQLVADLSQVIDWQGVELAGNVGVDLRWKQGEGRSWQANASADAREFQLAMPGMLPWRENRLQVSASLDGQIEDNTLRNLTAGRVAIVSGTDRCDAELMTMVPELSAETAWPVRFVVQGDVATWLPRLQAFLPEISGRPAGRLQLTGSGKFSTSKAELETTTLELNDLALDIAGLAIREHVARLETTGVFDVAAMRFHSPQTTLASTTIAMRADNVVVDLAPEATSVSGTIDYRGDLERLSSWLADPNVPRQWQLGGSLLGTVEAKVTQGVVQASWNTEIEQLSYATRDATAPRPPLANVSTGPQPGMVTQWVEPRVTLKGRGAYDPKNDALQIASSELVSSAGGLTVAGTVSALQSTGLAELQGEIFYDGVSVSEKLRPMLGNSLQITGKEQRKYAIRGPLFAPATSTSPQSAQPLVSDALQGQGSLGWKEVRYVGLTAGAAEMPVALDRGVVTFGPLNIPVSEGRITATPRIALNAAQPTLLLERGPAIDRVRISPEICHTWLKYVAPLLADATRAEGKFSVALAGAAVPLFEPTRCDVGGSLTIHTAEVGPGPLAQQYLALARQVRGLVERNPNIAPLIDPEKGVLLLPEQQVDFQVVDGRVHHRGLKMSVKDVVITTSGSVGLDQTIDLVAYIPVQESWIQAGSPFASMRGQSIAIPIRGDLRNPKPDTKALADLGTNLIRNAAQDAIQKEVNKGLQKLFGPLQPQGAP